MKTAALIPCRTGSKGIHNKNFKEFNGKPLYEWTLEAAKESKLFDKIILSSDGGFHIHGGTKDIIVDNKRPEKYSTDEASLDDLLVYYAKEFPDIELWCLLQPTSPLRTGKDILKAYKKISKEKYDSLVSVTKGTCMYWIENAVGVKGENLPIATYHIHKRPNRQDRIGWYRENGAIYFTKRYCLEQASCRLSGKIALFKMPEARSFEIDTPLDWKICEFLGGK